MSAQQDGRNPLRGRALRHVSLPPSNVPFPRPVRERQPTGYVFELLIFSDPPRAAHPGRWHVVCLLKGRH